MLRWRNISLHWRLMLLTMASSGIGMFVAMTLLFIFNDRRIREDKVEELRSAGDLIGTNSVAALVFEDEEEGARILQALHTRRNIRQCVLYGADGKLVARYRSAGFQGELPDLNNPQSETIQWNKNSLVLLRPLELEDRKIGAIYLEASLGDLQEARRDSFLLRIPAFALAILVVYLLTFLLRGSLTGPIQQLASVAREVADRKNYAVDNGAKAIAELVKQDAPRLALLDWLIPEMDGVVVCREILRRKAQAYTYLILLSSRESQGDIVVGLASVAVH